MQGKKHSFFQDYAEKSEHLKMQVKLLKLLLGPSELRPFKAMAHRNTREEAHLLSRPSELQPTEHPETQKLDLVHVHQTRQEYSRLTEINKAKFPAKPYISNDERNFQSGTILLRKTS